MDIRLATFNLKNDNFSALNTHWSRRKTAVCEFFNVENPDIIGTQELNYARVRELLQCLPDYDYIGEGRYGGQNGEYCAILYKKEKYSCIESGTFWLSKRPEKTKSRGWLALFPRICTWGRFIETHGEHKEIVVFNTHLDVLSPYARRDGLLQIVKYIEENYLENTNILMGDFNAKPKSLAMRGIEKINKDSGLFTESSYSVFYSLESLNGRTYHGFHGKVVGLPIDYIFVSKHIKIKNAQVMQKKYLGKYPSDHFPIILDCKIE